MKDLDGLNILIAGGSGFLGQRCRAYLKELGAHVYILTRRPKESNDIFWNPEKAEIETGQLAKMHVLINLSGENIGSQRWTKKRIKVMDFSRVGTTEFLASKVHLFTSLRQFICASGINAYGWDTGKVHQEEDPFGTDYISDLSRRWEAAADKFSSRVKVCKLRLAPVLSLAAGMLPAMLSPILKGAGAVLGSGKQGIPWIHETDFTRLVAHCIEQELEGSFNANGGQSTNAEFTSALAKIWEKKLWLPKAPGFLLTLLLGKRSVLVLKGTFVSNVKLKQTGFQFRHEELEEALHSLKHPLE